MGRNNLTIIEVYVPKIDRKEKQKFSITICKISLKINKKDQIIISGDLNARIGMQTINDLMGPHGETNIN